MEGSSTREEEEEEVSEREDTFSLYHPCYLFKEALMALFKCIGLEFGTKEKKNSVKAPSHSEDEDVIVPENTESNNHKTSLEVLPTNAEEAADHEYSSTTQNSELTTSKMVVRGGPRRSDLSSGSGAQTN